MEEKTVHLSDDFVIENGMVCRWVTYNDGMTLRADHKYQPGAEVVLMSYESENNGKKPTFYITFDYGSGGIGGNMDPDCQRWHGWRGTTNGLSLTAHGLRKIQKIRELKNGTISITVGPDLSPDDD